MKLALGTAQFGADYGIAGGRRITPSEITAILDRAHAAGIDCIDTAGAYGASESRLGHEHAGARFRIVTKLLRPEATNIETAVRRAVEDAMHRLDVERLYAVLAHRPDDLSGPAGASFWRALTDLRDEGAIDRIGVSVYRPLDAVALHAHYGIDIVQAPLNLLDQRLLADGALAELNRQGVEVHVRSVFLQGLLLLAPDVRPAWARNWSEALGACDRWIAQSGRSAASACLAFALQQPGIDRVVVGVDGAAQLDELIACAGDRSALPCADDLACTDEALLHPGRWPT